MIDFTNIIPTTDPTTDPTYTPSIQTPVGEFAPSTPWDSEQVANDVRGLTSSRGAFDNIVAPRFGSPRGDLAKNEYTFSGVPVSLDETHVTLSTGKRVARFKEFAPFIDNQERYAQQQSTLSKWTHGLLKLPTKVAVNILGGTVGLPTSLAVGIAEGSFQATYNNKFISLMDDARTWLDIKLPNHKTRKEEEMGFMRSLFTANFWAQDVGDGLAFMLGALGTEAVWAG